MVANFDVLVSILTLITGMAVVNGMTYFFYDRPKSDFALLCSNLIFLFLSGNILLGGVALLCHGQLEHYLTFGIGLQMLAVLNSIMQMLNSLDSLIFRLEERPLTFSIINISTVILNVALLAIFVIGGKMGGMGKIYAASISLLVMCIVHIYLLAKRGYLRLKWSSNHQKMLLKFGLPLLPHSLSFWLKSGVDKILITSACGLAANGIYSLAMSFGAIYLLFRQAFSQAFEPYLQKKITNITSEEDKRNIVKLIYKIMIGFILLSLPTIGVCWVVMEVVLTDKYAGAFQFIPWIIASLTIYSIYSLTIQFAYTSKKTLGIGIISFSGSIIQCITSYLFLLWWGIDGIKYSLVLGSLIISIGIWVYSAKVYPLPWLSFLKK